MRNALKMSSTKSCPKYAPKHTIAMKKYQNDEADALYSGWSPSPVESMAKFEMSEMSVSPSVCPYVRGLWPNWLILLVFHLYGNFYHYSG